LIQSLFLSVGRAVSPALISARRQAAPKEKLSFQDRIQSMRQKVPEPTPRPTARPGLGGGVFGRPAKAQPVKAKKRA
jgi:hypothetical protein